MEILIVIVAILILGAGAVASAGGLGGMTEPVRDTYAPSIPAQGERIRGADLVDVRFGTSVHGYSMEEVDAMMARMARELDERDGSAERDSSAQPEASAKGEGAGKEWLAASDDTPRIPAEPDPIARASLRATEHERRADAWRGRDTASEETRAWQPKRDD